MFRILEEIDDGMEQRLSVLLGTNDVESRRSIISRVTAICGASTDDCGAVPVNGKRDRGSEFVLALPGLCRIAKSNS